LTPAPRLPAFLWVLALGNLVVGTGAFVIGGIIEPMSDSLGLSVSATGQLMTVYAVANAVAAPVLLALFGRYRAKSVLIAAAVLLAAGNAASALAATWGSLALARVLMACAAGLFTPTAAALAVALVPPSMRGRALSVVFSGVGLSYIVGVPFGAWASWSRFGWPLAFWGVAAAAGLLAVLLSRAPGEAGGAPASLAGFARALRDRRAVLALAVTGMYFASIFTLFSYVGAFLREYAGVPAASIAPVLAGFGVAALAGTFAGGALADRFGATRVLYAICAGFIAMFAVIWAMPGRTGPLVAVFLAWGVIGFAFYASQQARLVALAPQAATVLLSLNSSMLYLGTAAGAAIGGAVIASVGYRGLPVMAGVLILGVVVLLRVTEPAAPDPADRTAPGRPTRP
jgi:predicted MFS family arabinose efflux permease